MIKEIMKKIKDIFLNSLYPNKKFYKELLKKKFSYSILYFISFIFLLNFVMFIVLLFKINIGLNFNNLKLFLNSFDRLPDNLIVNIENGFLSTNSNGPVFIWSNIGSSKKLIVVIDETAASEKIRQYKSSVLFTSTNIVIDQWKNKEIINLPYTKSDVKITKDMVINFKQILINIFPIILGFIAFYMLVLTPIFTIIFLLLFLSFITLIIYLIFKLWAKKLIFNKTLQISFHATTLPIIIYSFLLILDNSFISSINSSIFLFLSFGFIFISLYDAYL